VLCDLFACSKLHLSSAASFANLRRVIEGVPDMSILRWAEAELKGAMNVVLRAMGHGDYIIIADTNFPADAVARETTHGKLLRMDSNTAAHAVESLLSLMPLDTFVDDAAKRMEVVDNSAEIPQVQIEVQQVVDGVQGKSTPLHGVERFEKIGQTAQKHVSAGEFSSVEWAVDYAGKPVSRGAIGQADALNSRPLAEGPIYRIYSMTKPIVSLLALQMIEDGLLGLGHPVALYLPDAAQLKVAFRTIFCRTVRWVSCMANSGWLRMAVGR